ncbi:twin-arginine translocase TatA/TatE family subunit [Pelotomaculum terephthalicicum JT]|uniref:twin-arginine translocase TatA/TatE family subunit n=1 Tax=Pelotomaculum TaxID=191373 RepID=UPI0009CEF3C7|nr:MULTISPECIES: twin-arginine translocase TatA/TatE family subunit [Pelotomaculum]MCG9969339.1 twin-arginine translocase TatA/TatE family subunit [Pelotomaculum terephthalicicum JT]OPX86405.1 MAG: Sec-independent protein translocase protein TatAd [Pelotomaculum sp. PtaB.Bin117]OPY62134.1 MAG: Sec-independent protein translocase protein TatAd [Pelotomaculum sp. PtaU1.Bin065]
MPHIGATELVLILAVVLIIFGPGKLPELGKSLGRTIKEFRRSSNEVMDDTVSAAVVAEQEGQQAIKAAKS